MNSLVKICNVNNCNISVTGLEQDSEQYLNERQVSIRNYTWEDTITLNIILTVNSKEEEEMETYEVVPHTDIDSVDFTLQKDGLYKVKHIIMPTNEWFNYVKERDINHFDEYSIVYFFDLETERFFKYNKGVLSTIEIQEILEVNIEATNLVESISYTFEMCHIKECFFKLCKHLLENMPCECVNAKDFSDEILNRDIIWMAINVIVYLLEQRQYYKAQSILEQIETCWGICNNLDNKIKGVGYDCGCSH